MIKLLAIGLMSSSLGLAPEVQDNFFIQGGAAKDRQYTCTLSARHTADFDKFLSQQAPANKGSAICAFLEDSSSWAGAIEINYYANHYDDLQSINQMIMQTNTHIEKGGFDTNGFCKFLTSTDREDGAIQIIFHVNYQFLGHNLYSGSFLDIRP